MHSSDVLEVARIGSNIEISKDSSLHSSDAIEVVRIATSRGNHVTVRKQYHSSDLIEMAKIGRDRVTIEV
ncbi:TPA: hypothetical protein RQJ47_004333 [Vibrio vulnificus]|uniref:hypothetical protein n=1 Tax=Vibrio vulnificus TaxID=672 RepID=UPI000DAF4047|nr:hypothetical protein [Vibrio vulnificus]MDK2622458.1 hypothetical protein [Vibrio vulnificus]RAH21101.1 hypothetical protein DOT36_16795 [Vibrio vulnificus]HAU8300159.1 hypothetical protein [Vibrio vulnificus]HDY7461293.1 hypothetical protein [Vibrio vulnificus]HDY8211206.1 hypothetical protein [Vibrio vulnificus]